MKIVKALLTAGVMAILILDNRCALKGAEEGITLCLQTVIPSLFPFFVLSSILTSTVSTLPKPILNLFGVGPNSGGVLLSGLLGGYPVGAKSVSQAYSEGTISRQEAGRLLPICNQCGPAFLFGMTACLFDSPKFSALIWIIHILSAILLARLLPSPPSPNRHPSPPKTISLSAAMTQSLRSIATVCGWIVLFRVMFNFLDRWFLWALPYPVRITLCGLLELANGCTELWQITDPPTRFVLTVLLTGFGGICVSLQTFNMLHPDIDRHLYFPGKVTQAGISTLLASLLTRKLYPLGGMIIFFGLTLLTITKIRKKTVAIPPKSVYNEAIKEVRIELCSSEKR